MSERQYIVVEGVIGVGKTTLVEKMCNRLNNAQPVVEKHDANPFLADFYRDPRRYAFQTELFFLLNRYRQQVDELRQADLFARHIVADYLFSKSRIFASITLEEREQTLFNTVAGLLERDIPPPDLVVFLQSNTQRLMRNIRVRDRDYERSMNPDYIEALVEAYNHHFFRYKASDLLIVNATALDFVGNPDQFNDLFAHIMNAPEGVSYYNPATEE
ncbi:MAG: Deoxyguanosine kinase [Calditrichaeota bacterium]|nr:Deoxyguanosine kinase [Calditrichota bacterium]